MNSYLLGTYPPHTWTLYEDRRSGYYEGDVQFSSLRETLSAPDVIEKNMGELFDALYSADSYAVWNSRLASPSRVSLFDTLAVVHG